MKRTIMALIAIALVASLASFGNAADVIRIGLSAPITGNYAEYGQNFEVSVRMAIDEINAAGGILGKKVEVVVMDSKSDPKEAALIAQKFVDDPTILAEIGDFSSTACLAAAPIYERAGLTQLSPTASSPLFAPSGEYMFGIVGTQTDEGPFNAKNIAQDYMGLKKVATLYINNDWGKVTNSTFVEAAKKINLEVVTQEFFMDSEKDFTAVLTKIRQLNPDGIFLAAMYNEASAIARQIQKMGWKVKMSAPSSVFSSQLIALGGDAVEGLVTNTFFVLNDPNPKVQKYVKDFEARAKRYPNLHAACAYDAMYLLKKAMEDGGLTRKGIRDALAKIKGFQGVTGEITFTPVGDVIRSYKILVVEKGEWVIKK